MLHREVVDTKTWGLLKELMAKSALSGFHLAGGTSLALQIGHRQSFDLDFFGARPFDPQEILDVLYAFSPITIMTQSLNILILNVQNVKVDFVNYRYPLLFPFLEQESVRLLSPQDIGAMKLAAIAGRGRKRDFFDLFFLLRQFSLVELLEFYTQKYDDGSVLMVMRSLIYFEDADQDEDVVLIKEKISWNTVKNEIILEVKKIG